MPKGESLAELSGRTQALVKRYSLNPFKTRIFSCYPLANRLADLCLLSCTSLYPMFFEAYAALYLMLMTL
jgi:hypothetical protein